MLIRLRSWWHRASQAHVYCPWCGRPADINTTNPLTVSCDSCTIVTRLESVT